MLGKFAEKNSAKMAIVSNTLIGKTRGSVGNVTFTTWKGRNVIKEKSKPANPNSEKQAKQRLKFKHAFTFARLAVDFLVDYWSQVSLSITTTNEMLKFVIPYASDIDNSILDGTTPSAEYLRSFRLGAPEFSGSISAAAGSVINIRFPDHEDGIVGYWDYQVMFVDNYTGRVRSFAETSDVNGTITIPANTFDAGDSLNVMLALYSQNNAVYEVISLRANAFVVNP